MKSQPRQQLIKVDPELARLAYVTGLFQEYRLWVYATQVIDDGSGRIDKAAILAKLPFHLSPRQLDRYIKKSENIFWKYSKKQSRLYLISSVNVSLGLCVEASHQRFGWTLETNRPGMDKMLVDLSGSVQSAIANVYAAWFAAKDKGEGVTIARDTLCGLWGCSETTLRQWEKLAGISKNPNYAQSADVTIGKIPTHAYLCSGKDSDFTCWQLANTYHANPQPYPNNGQSRTVRKAVNKFLSSHPALIGAGGKARAGRRYFRKGAQADGWTLCLRHIRKHQDPFTDHYVYLYSKGGLRIYERFDNQTNVQMTGGRRFVRELDTGFRKRRQSLRYILNKDKNFAH